LNASSLVTPGVLPPQSAPSAACTIDAATMVFLGNRLLAHISLGFSCRRRPLAHILAELSLSPEICGALTGADTRFTDAFRISKAHEAADWHALSSTARKLGYPESEVPERFLPATSRAFSLSS
jgi:hypothetical protein